MAIGKRRATYEDLAKVPDTMVAELIDGELFVSPRPASPYARARTALAGDLFGAFDRPPGDPAGPGGWWLLFEPGLHLGSDVIVPDLAGWRRSRLPVLPNVAAFTLVPDWVSEVISPSTGEIDRGRKMRVYAREQVAHLWIIDPILRTLEVYRLEDGRWIVASTRRDRRRPSGALRRARAPARTLVARRIDLIAVDGGRLRRYCAATVRSGTEGERWPGRRSRSSARG
jgi:Uma2 family endonuclease